MGAKILADARLMQPHVEAVMMDQETLLAHVERGVIEARAAELPEHGLTLPSGPCLATCDPVDLG